MFYIYAFSYLSRSLSSFLLEKETFTTSFGKWFHRLVLYEELCLVCSDEVPNSFISCSLTLVLSAKLLVFSTSQCHKCFCRTLPYVPLLILSLHVGGLANAILLILVFFWTYPSSAFSHLETEDQNWTVLRTRGFVQQHREVLCFFLFLP